MGAYQDWLRDSALVIGSGRRYVLVGLTHHVAGDAYLEDLAREVEEVMASGRR